MKLHPRILITFYLFVRYIVLKYKSRKTLKPSPGRNGPHLLEVQQGHNPKKIHVQYMFLKFWGNKMKMQATPLKIAWEMCVFIQETCSMTILATLTRTSSMYSSAAAQSPDLQIQNFFNFLHKGIVILSSLHLDIIIISCKLDL